MNVCYSEYILFYFKLELFYFNSLQIIWIRCEVQLPLHRKLQLGNSKGYLYFEYIAEPVFFHFYQSFNFNHQYFYLSKESAWGQHHCLCKLTVPGFQNYSYRADTFWSVGWCSCPTKFAMVGRSLVLLIYSEKHYFSTKDKCRTYNDEMMVRTEIVYFKWNSTHIWYTLQRPAVDGPCSRPRWPPDVARSHYSTPNLTICMPLHRWANLGGDSDLKPVSAYLHQAVSQDGRRLMVTHQYMIKTHFNP